MLTQEIKQKIDSARDILVGKIPTPTGQVEQITLALVYKFMNDIDEQNVELGGSHKFFTGEYQKYAWKHLLDKSISAYERVTLYGEGLDKMHLNPNTIMIARKGERRLLIAPHPRDSAGARPSAARGARASPPRPPRRPASRDW